MCDDSAGILLFYGGLRVVLTNCHTSSLSGAFDGIPKINLSNILLLILILYLFMMIVQSFGHIQAGFRCAWSGEHRHPAAQLASVSAQAGPCDDVTGAALPTLRLALQ